MKKYAYIGLFLLTLLCCPDAPAAPLPTVRVLVEEGSAVAIDGLSDPVSILPTSGGRKESIETGMRIAVASGEEELVQEGRPSGRDIVVQNRSRRYRIGNRIYRGELQILWTAPGMLQVIDHLPIEEYLAGLLGSEIFPNWPAESLKAQAVAARTYALHHIDASKGSAAGKPYDVTATVMSQVYDGAQKEDRRTRDAVQATNGQVLTRSGVIFPAYFHSCCGGTTEHARNVWPGESGPPQISDPYCAGSPKLRWSFGISAEEFSAALRREGIAVGTISGFATSLQPDSPRAAAVIVRDERGRTSVEATRLRSLFGYSNIKSTWFTVSLNGSRVEFTGRGYGHGVGMCQWGAKGMADAGKSYQEILKFYYPDAELTTLY